MTDPKAVETPKIGAKQDALAKVTTAAVAAIAHEEAFRIAFEPANFQEGFELAKMFATIGFAKCTTPGEAMSRMMAGRALGLSAVQSMKGIFLVDGMPGLEATLMHALCLSHPEIEYFEADPTMPQNGEEVNWRAKRRGRPEQKLKWTIKQAERAGLLKKDNWQKDPFAMLNARCKAALARLTCPEAIHGMHTPDELANREAIETTGELVPEKVEGVVVQAPARDWRAEADAIKAKIVAASTDDEKGEARKLAKGFEGPDELKKELSDEYNTRHSKKAAKAEPPAQGTLPTEGK